jgi:hypothetical protein
VRIAKELRKTLHTRLTRGVRRLARNSAKSLRM